MSSLRQVGFQILFVALVMPRIAFPEIFSLPEGEDVIGTARVVRSVYEDTLLDIGRAYSLGYEEMRHANPDVDIWLPGEGTEVRLPTQFVLPQASRSGLVINIAEYRMYYFSRTNGEVLVATYPISIGRMDWETPLGRSMIVSKVKKPTWYPPSSIREEWAADGRKLNSQVPPGPDNPLGDFAMRLSIPGYLIHGTNRPAGVGMRVTHGCIRMYPEDIARLFPEIPVETPVEIINQPYKLGWSGDDLLLEVHSPLRKAASPAEPDQSSGAPVEPVEPPAETLTAITELYIEVTDGRKAIVDWELVETVFAQKRGIPVVIGYAEKIETEAVDDGVEQLSWQFSEGTEAGQ